MSASAAETSDSSSSSSSFSSSSSGGGLSAFAGLLERCMRSIDSTLGQMQSNLINATSSINTLQETVVKQAEQIRLLEQDNANMRLRIDGVVDNNSLLEKDIKQQITDNAATMHKELLVHRTGTKMDLTNLKGNLQKQITESIQKFEENQAEIFKSHQAAITVTVGGGGGGGGVDAETMNNLVQRIFQLESTIITTTNILPMIESTLTSNSEGAFHQLEEKVTRLHAEIERLSDENSTFKEAENVFNSKAKLTTPKIDGGASFVDFDKILESRVPFVGQRKKRFSPFYYNNLHNNPNPNPNLSSEADAHEGEGDGDGDNDSLGEEKHENAFLGKSNENENMHKHRFGNGNGAPLQLARSSSIGSGRNAPTEIGSEDNSSVNSSRGNNNNNNANANANAGGGGGNLNNNIPTSETIDNSIDAYTVAESDDMFHRISRIERFVLENNQIQFQVRRLMDGISEVKVEFDSMQTKLAAVRANADDSSNPDKVLVRSILASRETWSAFYQDLSYAIEIVADEDADREESNSRQLAMQSITDDNGDVGDDDDDEGINDNEAKHRDLFPQKLRELEEILKLVLDDFEIVNNSGADTAFKLFAQLDALTLKAEEVVQVENHIREVKANSSLDMRTFEDVYCMDRTKSLKSRLLIACSNTYPIMDKNVTTITMRRRLEMAEDQLSKKAERSQLNFIDSDIRKLLSTKAEHEELISVASKKASVVEVQKIKDILTRQIDQFKRGAGVGGIQGNVDGISFDEAIGKGGNLKAELADISKRFDLLFKHFQDLQAYCNGFHATREEVNEAFVHVLSELKGLKSISVPLDLFKDSMKTKADALELKKLISSLAETMGNLNGRGDASIVHVPIKCLTCNKPTTHIASAPDERKSILFSKSLDSLPISDECDDGSITSNQGGGAGNFPHTHTGKMELMKAASVARPTSKFIPSKKKDPMELPPIEKPADVGGSAGIIKVRSKA